MPSKQFGPSLPDAVPERDSRVVRHCAEHLEGLGLSDRNAGLPNNATGHIAVWLALDGSGLDKLDIRLPDRFMLHECSCPGWPRHGGRHGRHCRRFAPGFLRNLLEAGRRCPRRSRLADIWRRGSGTSRKGGDMRVQSSDRATTCAASLSGSACRTLPWRKPTNAFDAAFLPATVPAFIRGSSTDPPVPPLPDQSPPAPDRLQRVTLQFELLFFL